jgi:hypothetical protein
MKILRLKLEKWRGVESRDLDFAEGVTLIEGPNEIGKSTIVEAIQNLFYVMASSLKASVKAIQPVGQDVGSSVEIEVEVGDFHFVYAKTYNKDKRTELHVSKPRAEQLTGREAHERVEQILKSSVDMELWNALLVEQGNEIVGVRLSRSDGLARALDAATGSESPEQDDSDLFTRVQAEYEQYFTKTGKPKKTDLPNRVAEAGTALEAATTALLEVESDSDNHGTCLAQIRRFEEELPELAKQEREHQGKCKKIGEIRAQVKSKQGDFKAAQALLKAAEDDLARRASLVKSVGEGERTLNDAREKLSPCAERLATLKASADAAHTKLDVAKATLRQARLATELAAADDQHFERAARVALAKTNLHQLELYSGSLATVRQALQGVKMDASGLEALREDESGLRVAQARLDTAMSSVEIAAEDDLNLILNDDPLALSAGAIERRDFASDLRVAIPGVVNIRVKPSRSATELETEADELRAVFVRRLAEYGVKDLVDAFAVETKRASDEREAMSWSDKIEQLLGSGTAEDLSADVVRLDLLCKDYLEQRASEPALPDNLAAALAANSAARESSAECQREVDIQQMAFDELREKHTAASAEQRGSEKEAGIWEEVVEQRREELSVRRADEADETVQGRVDGGSAIFLTLQNELEGMHAQLNLACPDVAEELFRKAQVARQGVEKRHAEQQTRRAVLEDRLTMAQAGGRFEAREAASNKLVALEAVSRATLGRAAAAKHLWEVLSRHRDATRKAHGRPLKEGVEKLGRIVFGPDFAIEIDDDLSLISRTQDGKTIPFHDLSVGAKEQLGILMRLAAAQIVSSQGGVPLIIDDALGFADPSRLESMGAAIARAGEDCQIILLTCTPGRFKSVACDKVVTL